MNGITVKTRAISQEIAQKMIERSLASGVQQRVLRQKHVDWLADQIKRNQWEMNGETIIIDWNGGILDGQHRIMAVIQSGKTIETVVVEGVDPHSFLTIDVGLKRSGGDMLQITGEKNCNTLSSTLGWMYRYHAKALLGSMKGAGFTATLQEWTLKKHPMIRGSVDWATKEVKDYVLKEIPTSVLAFLHYMFSSTDADRAAEFFLQVKGESATTKLSGPWALRRWLKKKEGNRATLETAAITVKAWNAFMEKREMNIISWRRFGKNPESFPIFHGDKESHGVAQKAVKIDKRKGLKEENGE